jgi:hypothetical protein
MTLILKFNNLPPLPLNRAKTIVAVKGRPPMLIKTPIAREFEQDLSLRLNDFSSEIKSFKSRFDESKNYVRLELFAYSPKSELFTKSGAINSKCPDFDSNKLMIDVIFKGIDINDKYVKEANIKYLESFDEYWNFILMFHIENLDNLKVSNYL